MEALGSITRKIILLFSIVVSVVFIFVGYKLFMDGYNKMQEEKTRNNDYVETIGTVVGHDENDKRMQAIVVEYTVGDKKYRNTADDYTDDYVGLGAQIRIKYNPNNPEEVIWKQDVSKNNIVLIIIGGVVAGFGGLCALYNLYSLFKPDPVRRYVEKRPINPEYTTPQVDEKYGNTSLIDIAMEKRVGVFDPNEVPQNNNTDNNI